MKDGILTHNHPTRGGSFSDNDISSAMALDLQEIRAVRDKYLYVLTRTPGKWD